VAAAAVSGFTLFRNVNYHDEGLMLQAARRRLLRVALDAVVAVLAYRLVRRHATVKPRS
jgi:hypothetical protein